MRDSWLELRPRQLSRDRNLELVILLFNRNTNRSLGKLKKAVDTLAYRLVFPQNFSFSQKNHSAYMLSISCLKEEKHCVKQISFLALLTSS